MLDTFNKIHNYISKGLSVAVTPEAARIGSSHPFRNNLSPLKINFFRGLFGFKLWVSTALSPQAARQIRNEGNSANILTLPAGINRLFKTQQSTITYRPDGYPVFTV